MGRLKYGGPYLSDMARKFKNITGQKFGRLTAIELVPMIVSGRHRTYWRFRCDCGNDVTVRLDGVTGGEVQSCGCYQRDFQKERIKTTKGMERRYQSGHTPHNKGRPAVEWLGEEQAKAMVQRLRDNPPPPEHIKEVCEANKKPVVRMDLYGKVIEIHDSIHSAAKAVNRAHTGVGLVCNHHINKKGYPARTCGGHTFLFLDEYLERKKLTEKE